LKVEIKRPRGKPTALLYKLVYCFYKAAGKPATENAAALLARAPYACFPKERLNISTKNSTNCLSSQ
jgi:hypothetical protein